MLLSPESKTPLLSARNLFWQASHKRFSLLLSEATLNPGDLFGVTGDSGCGKSTLLGLLSLALRPASATYLKIMGQECAALWGKNGAKASRSLQKKRTDSMGFIPQTSALMPFLTARENICLSLDLRMPTAKAQRESFKQAGQERLRFLAEMLKIENCLDQYPATLSVGQRQRTAVARALIHNPAIILADEPTASLHQAQGLMVMELLAQQAKRKASGVIVVSHDLVLLEKAGFHTMPANISENKDKTRHTDFVLGNIRR